MDDFFGLRRRCLPALLLMMLAAAGPPAARADVLTSRLSDTPPAVGRRPGFPGARVDYRAPGDDDFTGPAARAGRQAPLSPLAALALVLVIPASAAVDPLSGGSTQDLQNKNNQNQNQNANNANTNVSIAGGPDPVGHAPEPGSLVLGLLGLAGLAVLSRRLRLHPAPAA